MAVVCMFELNRMKIIGAYLLALLGGNTSPTITDLEKILSSGALYLILNLNCIRSDVHTYS